MDKCIQAAQECEAQKNSAVSSTKNGAQAAKTGVETQNAARLAEAAQMGAKCGQSAENAKGLGEMPQMPQMPQMGGGAGSGVSGISDNSDADNSKKDTGMSQLGETYKIGAAEFGDPIDPATVASKEGTPDSFISGATASMSPGEDLSSSGKDFSPPPTKSGMGFNSSGGSGGSSGGMNSSGASKAGGAVAEGNAAGESNANEINFGGGGAKSLLGLKPKEGEEDLSALAAFVSGGDAKLAGAAGDAAAKGRGLASTKGSTAMADENNSLFKMVKTRYKNLRQVGKI